MLESQEIKFPKLAQVLSMLETLHALKHSEKTNAEVDTDLPKSSEYLSNPYSFCISLLQMQMKEEKRGGAKKANTTHRHKHPQKTHTTITNNPLTCVQLCEQKNHILELKSAREKCPDKFKALIV